LILPQIEHFHSVHHKTKEDIRGAQECRRRLAVSAKRRAESQVAHLLAVRGHYLCKAVAEMRFIRPTAEEFLRDPHIMESAQSLAAALPAWEATQVRLAKPIPRDEFPKLVVYYQLVAVLRNLLDMLRDA
jgi:hypothetical protein